MKGFLNRLSNADKVTIMLKILAVGTLALLMSSCASLDFRMATLNYVAQRQSLNVSSPIEVKTYTTDFQTFKNLNPEDLGLRSTGNWVHCRTHGFHDLNDWTDFSYSPYFCRPSQGFLQAAQWNWNWGGWNHWNNNWMWNPRHQFDYWGNNWSPWMGNVHYGYYGNYGYDRWGYGNWMGNVYYGQNTWYMGRSVYRGRRATNSYGRWETNTSTRRVNRITPTRTRTNVTPRSTRNGTVPIRVQPTRTRTIQNDVRPIRTPRRNSDVNLPTRTVPIAPSRTGSTVTPINTRSNSTPNTRTRTTNTRTKTIKKN